MGMVLNSVLYRVFVNTNCNSKLLCSIMFLNNNHSDVKFKTTRLGIIIHSPFQTEEECHLSSRDGKIEELPSVISARRRRLTMSQLRGMQLKSS